jgi:hypothetical protein
MARIGGLRLACALLACAVWLAPAAVRADDDTASEAGFGALAAVTSLVYAPVKIVYAVGGVVVGGLGWVLSGGDNQVATAVITPAVRGDYVVTPSILRGERSLEFIGEIPESP